MKEIAVFNLGISNLTSVLNVLDYIDAKYYLVDKVQDLKGAKKMILPGVGTFAAGMNALESKNFVGEIRNLVINDKVPIFGICLGMQFLFDSSEESPEVKGLGLISGAVKKIPVNVNYKIPRVGWGESDVKKDFLGLKKGTKVDFYYVHSYHACPEDKNVIAISAQDDIIVSAVSKENIFGCQFHPEKSYIDGIEIMKNFIEI